MTNEEFAALKAINLKSKYRQYALNVAQDILKEIEIYTGKLSPASLFWINVTNELKSKNIKAKSMNPFLSILVNLLRDSTIEARYAHLANEKGFLNKEDSRDIVKAVFAEYDMNVNLKTILFLKTPAVNYIPIFDFDTETLNNEHFLVFIAGISGEKSLMPILILKQNHSDKLIVLENEGGAYFISKYRFFYIFKVETIDTFCLVDENRNRDVCMFHRDMIATLLPHQLQE